MNRPLQNEFNTFFKRYIDLVSAYDGIEALKESKNLLLGTLRGIPESKANYKYAPSKWSVNDLVQHLIDTEIVFNYRALAIARGDKQNLPGFDHDDFVRNANADYRSLHDITNQFEHVRNATLALYKSFPFNAQENIGLSSDSELSTRAIAFIISGHCAHHHTILKERYL